MEDGRPKKCYFCKYVYFEEVVKRIVDFNVKMLVCPNCSNQLYKKSDRLHAMPIERKQEIIDEEIKVLDRIEYEIFCAYCNHKMVRRQRNSDGKIFYGCSMFGITNCRFTIEYDIVVKIRKYMKVNKLKRYQCRIK